MNFNFRIVLILVLGIVLGYGLNYFVSELIYKKYESSVTLDSAGPPPIPQDVTPVGLDKKPQSPEKFTDLALGVEFYISPDINIHKTTTALVLEGFHSIERFSKDPKDGLDVAISKKFSLQDTECAVKYDEGAPLIEEAFLTSVKTLPADQRYPDCGDFNFSGGREFFYYDLRFPDRYYLIKLGQAPLSTEINGGPWVDSLKVVK